MYFQDFRSTANRFGLVSKEIERRTIYTILAKPISRSQFILGKYLGLIITLARAVTDYAGHLKRPRIGRELPR